jgi:hypothetical protein
VGYAVTATLIAPASAGWNIVYHAGADPTGTNDCAAGIQALCDRLYAARGNKRGDTILIPDGLFKLSTEVVYYVENGYAQSIVGLGASSSRFTVPVDLGTGKYAIRPSNPLTSVQKPLLSGFMIRGKATSGVHACHGVGLPSGSLMRDVHVEAGFYAGIVGFNDHWSLDNVISQGCHYNLYFGYQNAALANQSIVNCDFTSPDTGLANSASIGIAGNNSFGGARMESVHLGAGPYGIYKEDAGDTANFALFPGLTTTQSNNITCASVRFTDVRWEVCTTALFGAANATNGARIGENVFLGCDQSGFTGTGSGIFCDYFVNNTFIRSESLLIKAGTGKYVEITGSAANISGNRVIIAGNLGALTTLAGADFDNKTGDGWFLVDGLGRELKVSKADEALAQGDVLMGWVGGFVGSFKKFDSTQASAVAGVAYEAAANGAYFLRLTKGLTTRVNIIGGATPDAQAYLIPTTTAGKANATADGVAATVRPFARALSGDNGGYCSADLL